MRFFLLVLTLLPFSLQADPFVEAVHVAVRLVGEGASGTGFLVKAGEDRIILATAAHVFDDLKGETCQVIFRHPKESGGFERTPIELTIRKGEEVLWKRHPKHDIAIIEIVIPEKAAVRPVDLDQLAPEGMAKKGEIGVGREVCIPCFPVGTEANEAGWPVLRRGTVATHPLTPLAEAETFFVDVSSFGGESGAPVVAWKGDKVFVIGVVSSMQRQTEKSKTALEEKTTHLPMGLGIVVQSPFLRDMIAQMVKNPSKE